MLLHTSWGSERRCLIRLYNSLVRSRLDDGAVVYGSARQFVFKMRDPVHHLGLTLAGTFWTSPLLNLYAGTHQKSLEKGSQYISLFYDFKMNFHPVHPLFHYIGTSMFLWLFEYTPHAVRPLSIRLRSISFSLQLTLPESHLIKETVSPWKTVRLLCALSLTNYNKRWVSHQGLEKEFLMLSRKMQDCAHLVDGTKLSSFVGCAVDSSHFSRTRRMDSVASVFLAELYAPLIGLEHFLKNRVGKAILFVDSYSALLAICYLTVKKNHLPTTSACSNELRFPTWPWWNYAGCQAM